MQRWEPDQIFSQYDFFPSARTTSRTTDNQEATRKDKEQKRIKSTKKIRDKPAVYVMFNKTAVSATRTIN